MSSKTSWRVFMIFRWKRFWKIQGSRSFRLVSFNSRARHPRVSLSEIQGSSRAYKPKQNSQIMTLKSSCMFKPVPTQAIFFFHKSGFTFCLRAAAEPCFMCTSWQYVERKVSWFMSFICPYIIMFISDISTRCLKKKNIT